MGEKENCCFDKHSDNVINFVNEKVPESSSADVESQISNSVEVLTNIARDGLSRGAGERGRTSRLGSKHFLSFVDGCSTNSRQDMSRAHDKVLKFG